MFTYKFKFWVNGVMIHWCEGFGNNMFEAFEQAMDINCFMLHPTGSTKIIAKREGSHVWIKFEAGLGE